MNRQQEVANPRRGATRLIAVLAALTLTSVACGSSSNGSTGRTRETSAPTADGRATEPVRVVEFTFEPSALEVATGTTVVWTNEDSVLHTVTSGSFQGRTNEADGLFELELKTKGSTASHTFAEAGTYTYFCSQHNVMNATVRVTA